MEKTDLFLPCSSFYLIDVWWRSCNCVSLDGIESQSAEKKLEFIKSALNRDRFVKELDEKIACLLAKKDEAAPEGQVLKFSIPRDYMETFEFMSMFGRPVFYTCVL